MKTAQDKEMKRRSLQRMKTKSIAVGKKPNQEPHPSTTKKTAKIRECKNLMTASKWRMNNNSPAMKEIPMNWPLKKQSSNGPRPNGPLRAKSEHEIYSLSFFGLFIVVM